MMWWKGNKCLFIKKKKKKRKYTIDYATSFTPEELVNI